mmetsp:Transcript_93787/g.271019  ORF Transcript_93787/g.271019 Transcript_93787/m.271019 type:complete len:372 (+) Transcript_93787:415-1530(+)
MCASVWTRWRPHPAMQSGCLCRLWRPCLCPSPNRPCLFRRPRRRPWTCPCPCPCPCRTSRRSLRSSHEERPPVMLSGSCRLPFCLPSCLLSCPLCRCHAASRRQQMACCFGMPQRVKRTSRCRTCPCLFPCLSCFSLSPFLSPYPSPPPAPRRPSPRRPLLPSPKRRRPKLLGTKRRAPCRGGTRRTPAPPPAPPPLPPPPHRRRLRRRPRQRLRRPPHFGHPSPSSLPPSRRFASHLLSPSLPPFLPPCLPAPPLGVAEAGEAARRRVSSLLRNSATAAREARSCASAGGPHPAGDRLATKPQTKASACSPAWRRHPAKHPPRPASQRRRARNRQWRPAMHTSACSASAPLRKRSARRGHCLPRCMGHSR